LKVDVPISPDGVGWGVLTIKVIVKVEQSSDVGALLWSEGTRSHACSVGVAKKRLREWRQEVLRERERFESGHSGDVLKVVPVFVKEDMEQARVCYWVVVRTGDEGSIRIECQQEMVGHVSASGGLEMSFDESSERHVALGVLSIPAGSCVICA